ncbi:MAG: hypothetical protein M1812_006194 [Candelaria pacifica]|nr:MAG: hypothetical protein M1812_006194 [Candelaria pacifica]
MSSEEMQEILAVPDPDSEKFNPDNAVRRSVRAAKTPKLLAAEPVTLPPRRSNIKKPADHASESATTPPARKKQKRRQAPKGLQSPPATPASGTVQNAKSAANGSNSSKIPYTSEEYHPEDNDDIEMNDEDWSDGDAGEGFVPGSKKRPRAKKSRAPSKPTDITMTVEANAERMVPEQEPVAGADALMEDGHSNSGILASLPVQLDQNGVTDEHAVGAQTVVATAIGVQAEEWSNGRPPSDGGENLDPKLSVELQTQLPGTERPDSQGQPLVWAEGRQALCESLPYYRGYQSGGYSYGGLIYGFLLDKECHSRDYMDATVVITRAGGGLTKDKTSGAMVQNEDQSESAQVKAMRNNIDRHVPIVLIVGNSNPKCPSTIPHTYCVMGWFKPTHIWSEMDGSKKLFKYRLEKMDMGEPSWWAPKALQDTMPRTKGFITDLSETNIPVVDISVNQPPVNGTIETGSSANLVYSTLNSGEGSIPAARYECCSSCQKPSPQVYFQGWMCLNAGCDVFWKLHGRTTPGLLTFDLRFLRQQVQWPAMNEPYGLKPDPVSIDGQHQFGFDVSYAAWKGFVCPQCGRCNSRQDWQGWKCLNETCGFVHNLPHVAIPVEAISDPNHPFAKGHAIPRDKADPSIETQVEFFKQYRVHTYTVPECGTIVHFMANKVINEEPGGPDEMWHDMQSADIGLKRRELQNGLLKGGMLTQHFAMNYGMPYKYAVAIESKSFEDCCQAIRSARSRLNWAGRYVAGTSRQHQEFNELLALGYFEKQEIDFHDDGEFGLGPTIATLSLGYPATMKIRMKSKHYSGVSRAGVYLHEDPPVPGSLHYDARLEAYRDMDGIRSSTARKTEGKAVKGRIGMKHQNCPVLLSMHLNHGDIVVMHGEKIQKYYEHAVQPVGQLRFALTCRYIDPTSLSEGDVPKYDVDTDDGFYDGEHPVIASIPTPPSTAGNGDGLPEASDLPALEASIE